MRRSRWRAALRALAAGSSAAASRQASRRRTPALSARERALSSSNRLASPHGPARARRPAARGARGRDGVDHPLGRDASGCPALAARGRRAGTGHPRIPALPAERRHAGGRPPADGLVRRPWLRLRCASTSAERATPAGSSRTSTPSRSSSTASRSSRGSPHSRGATARSAWSGRRGAASTPCSSRHARRRLSPRWSASMPATIATPMTCTTAGAS